MSTSIKISQLNNYPAIRPADFIPIIDSASLTTYRTPVTSLGNYIAASGSVISASWASSSLSSSNLFGPATGSLHGTASNAISSSFAVSSSYATTASFSVFSINSSGSLTSDSSSWSRTNLSSSHALLAITASYFDFSVSPQLFVSSSLSSSWASSSLSSSHAISSSYAITSSYTALAATASYLSGAGGTSITWLGGDVPIGAAFEGTQIIDAYSTAGVPLTATAIVLFFHISLLYSIVTITINGYVVHYSWLNMVHGGYIVSGHVTIPLYSPYLSNNIEVTISGANSGCTINAQGYYL